MAKLKFLTKYYVSLCNILKLPLSQGQEDIKRYN